MKNKTIFPQNVISLNCARNCLRYTIKAYNIKTIHIPYYTCPTVWQAIQKEHCKIHFYHIDKNFMPVNPFDIDDYILYTNYFGICAKNIKELDIKYPNLIVDNAQAFFMPEYGIASFNSLRKFLEVPDGAFLYIDKHLNLKFEKDTFSPECSFTHKSINIASDYPDYYANENRFQNEDIKIMSDFTKKLYTLTDIKYVKEKRLSNFYHFHNSLADINELKLKLCVEDVPMYYPLLINNETLKNSLIKNGIFLPKYWNSMQKNWTESYIREHLLLLPINEKYEKEDIKRIIDIINTET